MKRALTRIDDVQLVAQLTGPGSINRTDTRWEVSGTDLGHMFSLDSRLYMVFGDTYGRGFTPPPNIGSARFGWRRNTMAVIARQNPARGLLFESMINDRPGHAKELLPAGRGAGEVTVIPTAGIAIGRRMVLHAMSVRRWQGPGRWTTNSSGLAYSDDMGATWIQAPGPAGRQAATSLRWRSFRTARISTSSASPPAASGP